MIRIVILRTEQVPIIMPLHNLSTCIHAGINEKSAFKRIPFTRYRGSIYDAFLMCSHVSLLNTNAIHYYKNDLERSTRPGVQIVTDFPVEAIKSGGITSGYGRWNSNYY